MFRWQDGACAEVLINAFGLIHSSCFLQIATNFLQVTGVAVAINVSWTKTVKKLLGLWGKFERSGTLLLYVGAVSCFVFLAVYLSLST